MTEEAAASWKDGPDDPDIEISAMEAEKRARPVLHKAHAAAKQAWLDGEINWAECELRQAQAQAVYREAVDVAIKKAQEYRKREGEEMSEEAAVKEQEQEETQDPSATDGAEEGHQQPSEQEVVERYGVDVLTIMDGVKGWCVLLDPEGEILWSASKEARAELGDLMIWQDVNADVPDLTGHRNLRDVRRQKSSRGFPELRCYYFRPLHQATTQEQSDEPDADGALLEQEAQDHAMWAAEVDRLLPDLVRAHERAAKTAERLVDAKDKVKAAREAHEEATEAEHRLVSQLVAIQKGPGPDELPLVGDVMRPDEASALRDVRIQTSQRGCFPELRCDYFRPLEPAAGQEQSDKPGADEASAPDPVDEHHRRVEEIIRKYGVDPSKVVEQAEFWEIVDMVLSNQKDAKEVGAQDGDLMIVQPAEAPVQVIDATEHSNYRGMSTMKDDDDVPALHCYYFAPLDVQDEPAAVEARKVPDLDVYDPHWPPAMPEDADPLEWVVTVPFWGWNNQCLDKGNRDAALKHVENKDRKNSGFTAASMALAMFSSRKKDEKRFCGFVLQLFERAGIVEKVETGKKDQVYVKAKKEG
jgi:hypothetical protein